MASTYSTNLKIELIATGEQAGTWGTTTNGNLGTALEEAIVGYGEPIFTSDADLTITLTDSNASQIARCFALNVTSSGALTATRNLIVPTIQKTYLIYNDTTGTPSGQSIVVKTSAGTGITVPNGARTLVYVDGTNVVSSVSNLTTLTLNTALPATSGGTGQTGYSIGDLLYASTTTALSKLTDVATGNALISGGLSTAPAWGKIGLTTHVSGTLPVANGGTGQTTYTDGQLLIGNTSGNTLTKATLTAGTGVTITNGNGTITIAGNTGTVTSVSGTGTVNGLTLTGTVTSSGSLTLGGTLTGTASLNINGTVGLTTPAVGAFTIVNSNSGINITGTSYALDANLSTTASAVYAVLRNTFGATNGSTYIGVESSAGGSLVSGSSAYDSVLSSGVSGRNVWIGVNNVGIARVSSTGLAVTGSLTVSGTITGSVGAANITGTLPVANGGTGATTSTGSGAVVLATSPTLTTPNLGTPSAATLTNATGLPLTTGVTGTLPVANGGTGAATIAANNVILGNGTSAVQVVAPSTSGNVLQSDGTTWASTAKLTLATAQATTSGVSKEFTSIPSWVKRITMMFDGVSTNAGTTNLVLVQLGSTTYTTSGYDSAIGATNGASVGGTGSTSGFAVMWIATTLTASGAATFTLMGSNTWVYTSNARYDTSAVMYGAGRIALSGALDRIKLLTANGTDTFDAGSINILYE
jgi:hypothetical protein